MVDAIRLQALLERLPGIALICDSRGRIHYCNRAHRDACQASRIRDLLPEALCAEINKGLRAVRPSMLEYTGEAHAPYGTGSDVVWSVRVARLEDARCLALYGVFLDPLDAPASGVSEMKLLENKILRLRLVQQEIAVRMKEQTSELRRSKEALQALSRSLISAQESERRRIAQDIHDQAGEMITVANIELENLRRAIPAAGESLNLIKAIIAELSHDLRAICYGLHPVVLDRLGLSAAVEHYVNEFQKGSSFSIQSRIEYIHPNDLPPDVALFFYRALQESLTNISRHAGPCSVSVRLDKKGRRLIMNVKDTGRGFDPGAQGDGLGLFGMRERAAACGASVRVTSCPGAGATVSLSYTLPHKEENAHDQSGNRG